MLLITVAGLTMVSTAARPEQKPLPRVGVLLPESSSLEEQLAEQLRARGYIDGKTVNMDWRRYSSWGAKMRTISDDLVRSGPDLIVVFGTPPARAVVEATKTIPVVFVAGEPVAMGLVSSLSRPGGNATGASGNYVEAAAKLLDFVTQLVPGAHRVVAVRNPSNPLSLGIVEQVQRLAPGLRVRVIVVDARNADEVVSGLRPIGKRRADAILIPPDFVFQMETERVLHAVRETALPAVYLEHAFAEAGGLVSYGPDPKEFVQIVAALVEKILKGANPAELPVEQVSNLKLSVNLKTAKEMKISIPQSILMRAEEVTH
ncbi:MAG TPA: ABC transporter substrate-binding protein [Steroidobacteraceae bacterium]|nr:ABC transporter substrate-binding protein [Steroidobacteraceae bacterium]